MEGLTIRHRDQLVDGGEETAPVLIVSAPRTSGYEPLEWA
jgi:hypothetical protein